MIKEIVEPTDNQKLAVLHITNLSFELDRLQVKHKMEKFVDGSWSTNFSKVENIGGFYPIHINFEESDGYSGGTYGNRSTRHPQGSLKMKVHYANGGRGSISTFKATSPSLDYKSLAEKIFAKVTEMQKIKDRQDEDKRSREERNKKVTDFRTESKGFWGDGLSSNRKISIPYRIGASTTITIILPTVERALEVAKNIQDNWKSSK